MTFVELVNITKKFGTVTAVDGVNLKVGKGDFLSLLGPSGCGKTTTLRIIAGLEKPDDGKVIIDGRDVTNVPPWKRNIGLVFQNYALFPHMSVFKNIAYGLKLRKVPDNEIKKRVDEVSQLLGIRHLLDRLPRQLSGGQQQRVALARSLVINPEVLLLDEPLSNLDAKLRESLRFELKQLQKKLSLTAVYVTHDQAEAFVLSDRIAVMKDGKIVEEGSPHELYFSPRNVFVASFVGENNTLEGKVSKIENDKIFVSIGNWILKRSRKGYTDLKEGDKVAVIIKAEGVEIIHNKDKQKHRYENILEGVVTQTAFLGSCIRVVVNIDGISLKANLYDVKTPFIKEGDNVCVGIREFHLCQF